jgi:hypothetical protein
MLLIGLVLTGATGCTGQGKEQKEGNHPLKANSSQHQLVQDGNAFQLKQIAINELKVRHKGDRVLVDLNLGENPDEFLDALWRQLLGAEIPLEIKEKISKEWEQRYKWRRIDVALALAKEAGVKVSFEYSDPWVDQPELIAPFHKTSKRELGAVCMFFFNCPDGVNGKMSWANNHAPGMKFPDDLLKLDDSDSGYLTPKNKGFWAMELRDATYAGLDFLLLNTYGPDIEGDKMQTFKDALEHLEEDGHESLVKIGLFDDTWTWGKPYFGPHWKQVPDMEKPVECVDLIYNSKWKPFFSQVPRKHWYLYDGKPVIYFYNGGTIQNRHNAAEVFRGLKQRFKADFGVEPFLCVDGAFNKAGVKDVVDQTFKWFSIAEQIEDATVVHKNVSMSHAMVRWDATSRSNGQVERQLQEGDLIYKNGDMLKKFLDETQDKDLAIIATWNDLGEGTGINRCFDYYWDGQFQKPSVFMDMIRASQQGERLLTPSKLEQMKRLKAEETPTIH